jgi:hypothetical protein
MYFGGFKGSRAWRLESPGVQGFKGPRAIEGHALGSLSLREKVRVRG